MGYSEEIDVALSLGYFSHISFQAEIIILALRDMNPKAEQKI